MGRDGVARSMIVSVMVSLLLSILLTIKASTDNLYTGPHVSQEIIKSFSLYAIFSLARLTVISIIIMFVMAILGSVCYIATIRLLKIKYSVIINIIFSIASIFLITLAAFVTYLFYLPSMIVVSFNYEVLRLIPLWRTLTPFRIYLLYGIVFLVLCGPVLIYAYQMLVQGNKRKAVLFLSFLGCYPLLYLISQWNISPPPVKKPRHHKKYNILMIGSDTLRADRLGINGNPLGLTPNIDRLGKKGVNFSSCVVPIARTAPSLTALFTSTWPMTNGVRVNFNGDDEVKLSVSTLPKILKRNGYVTVALGDWAAGDLGMFDFGFDKAFVPEDQWNLKFLLRQGPKDIRLFLSLFLHNNFGKYFVPELYYLAGVPLTSEMGREARRLIADLANGDKPFFLNVFIATTHGPFGSPWPYYHMYSEPNYTGRSMFSMSGLSSPEEIVKAQEAGKKHFDVRQIFNLYNGAVKSFDDEIGKIIRYLHETGLEKNTIVVIYSDHGTDLFEGATWGQGNVLSDYGYRIPLVIYHPGYKYQQTIDTTVRSIDISPTLLDMVDMTTPDEWEGDSLLPMIVNPSRRKDRVAYAETGIWIAKVRGLPADRIKYPTVLDLLEVRNNKTGTLSIKKKYKDTLIRAKARMARKGKWELVYFPLNNGVLYSLYDINSDPALLHDVSSQYPEIVAELKPVLNGWVMRDR